MSLPLQLALVAVRWEYFLEPCIPEYQAGPSQANQAIVDFPLGIIGGAWTSVAFAIGVLTIPATVRGPK